MKRTFGGSGRRTPTCDRTLALYEEAIRQLILENDALRQGATVVSLLARSRTCPRPQP
jgi:hypothetical protein